MDREKLAMLLIVMTTLSSFGYAFFYASGDRSVDEDEVTSYLRKGFTVLIARTNDEELKGLIEKLPESFTTNLNEVQVIVRLEKAENNESVVTIRSLLGNVTLVNPSKEELINQLCSLLVYKPIACLNLTP